MKEILGSVLTKHTRYVMNMAVKEPLRIITRLSRWDKKPREPLVLMTEKRYLEEIEAAKKGTI